MAAKGLVLFTLLAFLGMLLGGCSKSPSQGDVVGVWINPAGGRLSIKASGDFDAQSLPRDIFWRRDQPGELTGRGTWTFQPSEPYWEVVLRFKELSGRPADREIKVLVSGSDTTTTLYQWKGEEGEDRYELRKAK